MQNRPPFPAQWHKKLLDLVSDLDNPLLVQLATLSGKTYPESRTVILRFVPSLEKLYVCTNTTYPKWKQVKSHPYVALSTYAQTSRLALRLKANTSCFDHDSSFSYSAWKSMPELDRNKFLEMAKPNNNGVSAVYGCIELFPHSWTIDQTGKDGWTYKREIFQYHERGNRWDLIFEKEFGSK
jgi:uncharacterized pyridoxamine 5'-phosphate oxidase family protein